MWPQVLASPSDVGHHLVMTASVALTLASAAAFLGLAVLVVVRRGRRTLAVPMSLMCLAMSTYNALDALGSITGNFLWDRLSYSAAALLSIPTWLLLVGFVGLSRRLRWLSRLLALYFSSMALATLLLPLWRADMSDFPGGPAWSLAMLGGLSPFVVVAVTLLVRHSLRSRGEELARARLLAGSLLLGVGGSVLDLALIASGSSLRISAVPLLISAALTAGLVMKTRLLEGVTVITMVNVAVLVTIAVIAHILVYSLAGASPTVTIFGIIVVLVGLLAALRPLLSTLSEQRERGRYLATLGRFSEQMAHDIRNPLAAIRGAAQFLQEELARGRSMDPHAEFVDLIVERSDRLERVIKDYQRMGRVTPLCEPMSLNGLVQDVVGNHALAPNASMEVELDLDPALPELRADRDLLAHAVENLVRNAVEAMPEGGRLSARTELLRSAGGAEVSLRVSDTGSGMDARARERALDDFFTTKSSGTGLGLSYVARVVEAHGGHLSLDSEEQVGTTVELVLPARAET